MTFTPTVTQTKIDNLQPAIGNVVIIPNPYNPDKGDLKIRFEITHPCKLIKVKIYTMSFRLMKQMIKENITVGEIEIESRY
jgi:hypothetical protein